MNLKLTAVLTDVDIVEENARIPSQVTHRSSGKDRWVFREGLQYCTSIEGTFHVDGNLATTRQDHSIFERPGSLNRNHHQFGFLMVKTRGEEIQRTHHPLRTSE